MVKDDAANDALHASHNHVNDLPFNKGRAPFPDIIMNPWHVSVEILNCRFIFQQVPEGMDQVWKMGLNRCDKALILDPAVNLCLPESPRPLLALLCPGYALLHIPPRQLRVNLTIISLD